MAMMAANGSSLRVKYELIRLCPTGDVICILEIYSETHLPHGGGRCGLTMGPAEHGNLCEFNRQSVEL